MTLKETRRIDAMALRSICIEHQFYTCGDCEDYDNMLNMVYSKSHETKSLTSSLVLKIATDIAEHSDMDELTRRYNEDEKGILEEICYLIIDKSYTCCEVA